MTQPLTFVHITDLHIGDPAVEDDHLYSDTATTLAAILAEIRRLSPQPRFIVASGDLTNRGDVGAYEALKTIIAAAEVEIPILFALGNHDTREGFYRAMLGRTQDLDRPYDHATVIDGLHVIVLDSSAPFRVGGTLDAGQFAWLEGELEQHASLPKLLVMHHAPALDDNRDLEWESLAIADTERLRALLAGRNIVGILSGHIHYDRVSHWYGIPLVVGVGQHAATDVLHLHEGLRMVAGASFAVGALRPSGLTVSFVPQPGDRRELHRYSYADLAALVRRYEELGTLSAAQ